MSETEDRIAHDRGVRAKALLENELFVEANQIMAKRVMDRFAETDPRNEKELAYLRRVLQAQADFNTYFAEIVQKGENAAARIKDNERRGLLSLIA